jgi:hypothetical protein
MQFPVRPLGSTKFGQGADSTTIGTAAAMFSDSLLESFPTFLG